LPSIMGREMATGTARRGSVSRLSVTPREALGYLRPAYVRGAVSDAVDAIRWSARGARLGAAAEHRFLHQPFKVAPAPTQLYPLVAAPDLRGAQGGAAIASLADQLMREGFAVLGSTVMLDSPLPWHDEWTAGFRYPRMPTRLLSRRIRFSPGYDQGVDCKLPWELGRLQHIPLLAEATAATGRDEYGRVAVRHIADFVTRNPVGRGVQWLCTMDVAIRAVNLVWSFARLGLLREGKSSSPYATYVLRTHAEFIERHLEDQGVVGNHYLADLAGLILLGWALNRRGEGYRWWRFGLEELYAQILRQFSSDGVNFESSTSYHRLATELALYPVIVALSEGERAPEPVTQRLERAIQYVAHYTQPDGTAPAIGDADDGRLLILSERSYREKNWHEYLVPAGALALRSRRLARLATCCDPETSALLGAGAPHALAKLQEGPRDCRHELPGSRGFPEGGLWVMRDGDLHMTFRAGGVGQEGNGGHAHNDCLSITLHALGEPWIVDSGLGCYTADYAIRNHCRSTRAHNTIMVDEQEINPFLWEDVFRMQEVAHPRVLAWESDAKTDRIVAEHYGYRRLDEPIVHRREVVFEKTRAQWRVRDSLIGKGRHTFELTFHLVGDTIRVHRASSCEVRVEVQRSATGRLVFEMEVEAPGSPEVGVLLSQEDVYISYNRATKATMLRLRCSSAVPFVICSIISVRGRMEPSAGASVA